MFLIDEAYIYITSLIIVIVSILIYVIDHIFDSRVRDLSGKLLPGPRSNLYGENFYSIVITARKNCQASKAVEEILLPKV